MSRFILDHWLISFRYFWHWSYIGCIDRCRRWHQRSLMLWWYQTWFWIRKLWSRSRSEGLQEWSKFSMIFRQKYDLLRKVALRNRSEMIWERGTCLRTPILLFLTDLTPLWQEWTSECTTWRRWNWTRRCHARSMPSCHGCTFRYLDQVCNQTRPLSVIQIRRRPSKGPVQRRRATRLGSTTLPTHTRRQ